jgi:hypothetical protein
MTYAYWQDDEPHLSELFSYKVIHEPCDDRIDTRIVNIAKF